MIQQAFNRSTNNTEDEPHFFIYRKRRCIYYISANHGELTFHCDNGSYNKSSYQQQHKNKSTEATLIYFPRSSIQQDGRDKIAATACHVTFLIVFILKDIDSPLLH